MRSVFLAVATVFVAGCTNPPGPPVPAAPAKADIVPPAAGLHNVRRLSEKILCGATPEGDGGFVALRTMGVRTVVSVDGMKPDVEAARRAGLRYVHIPVGYDGVPQEAAWRLAKAVRELPGPVYIHCHHGQHRGPAAAAVAWRCLDDRCTVEAAVEAMRQAGTGPEYLGLYAAPAAVRRPTAAELDAMPADFPETAAISALADHMVAVDERWDRLNEARSAGWKAPGRSDAESAHEALLLREHFREAARLPGADRRPADFRAWLADSERAAGGLESALRARSVWKADTAFQAVQKDCRSCHAAHRNRRPGS